MLPYRKCSPRESDMSRYRSSEQAARASRKQMDQATNSGGIAHSRHPTRPARSQCSGRRHFKRMGPDHSSDLSSLLRTVKPNLEHLYSPRRRLSNSVYLRNRRRNSSTCPLRPLRNSSDLRNRRPNNIVLHSHSQRLSTNVCPHNPRFKNNVLPRNLLLNKRDPHNLPLSHSDPLNRRPNNNAYPHSLGRRRASMAVRSLSRPRPNHECIHKSSYQKRLPCISSHPRSAPILLPRRPFLPSSLNYCSQLRTNTLRSREAWDRCS